MKSRASSTSKESATSDVAEEHCKESKDFFVDVLSNPVGSTKRATDTIDREKNIARQINGVVIGKVMSCDGFGAVTVDYPGNSANRPLVAFSVSPITVADINKDVALMFEAGNPNQPIIMGRIQQVLNLDNNRSADPINVQLDGKRLTFTADQEIVLRCGDASITLTRAGKVLIRGQYLLSRSTGTNRIKGGSVQIN